MASTYRVEQALNGIEAEIRNRAVVAAESWPTRFADVRLIASERPLGSALSAGSRDVYSPHAALLSALFERLRDAFSGCLDHVTKIEFYARLGNVANDWHSRTTATADSAELLRWVLQEARVILREIEEGNFEGFVIAPGDMVVADVLRRLERGESLDEDEMALYESYIRSRPD